MKKLSLIILSILSFSLPACNALKDVTEEDIDKAQAFAACVKGCYESSQADPELLQP